MLTEQRDKRGGSKKIERDELSRGVQETEMGGTEEENGRGRDDSDDDEVREC